MNNPAYDAHCRYSISHQAMAANIDEHTTMENLELRKYDVYHSAIIPYHDYVIYAVTHCIHGCSSAVYRFDTDKHTIEDPISLIALYYYDSDFDDMGDAVRKAMAYAEANQAHELMKRKV